MSNTRKNEPETLHGESLQHEEDPTFFFQFMIFQDQQAHGWRGTSACINLLLALRTLAARNLRLRVISSRFDAARTLTDSAKTSRGRGVMA